MFNKLKNTFATLIKSRVIILGAVFVAMFLLLIFRCFYLQIIKGEEYLERYTLSIQKTREVKGTRGNIYDRNGNLLAYNELAYSITIEDNGEYDMRSERNESINGTLNQVIDIVEANGDVMVDDFGIVIGSTGEYEYKNEGTSRQRFIADVYGKARIDDLTEQQKSISAPDLITYLCTDSRYGYGIDMASFTQQRILQLVNLRYSMSLTSYQKYIPTTLAEDVSEETVVTILENTEDLQGISIGESSLRRYNDSEYFSTILGYTGTISETEYTSFQEEGYTEYTLTDVVGKSGLEQSMDSYLQGTKGEEKIYVNSVGRIIESISTVDAKAGNDLYLTIDSELQINAYKILEEKLAGILLSRLENTLTFNTSAVEDSSEIKIPIGDVYNAFFANSILDISRFDDEDAKETEQIVFSKYQEKEASVLNEVLEYMNNPNGSSYADLPREMQAYVLFIVNDLLNSKSEILVNSLIDREDEVYKQWVTDESINLYTYLNYAIAQNWIDTTKLQDYMGTSSNYSDSTEIYQAILSFLREKLPAQTGFSNVIYRYMIRNEQITGREICLLIYEQEVLPFNESQYNRLKSGELGSYEFLRAKIQSLEITPGQLGLEPCSGSAVITDPNTGEVLAMVSYPGYDNNRLANTMDSSYYNKLVTDLAAPFYNHATQEKTAPGSTFKMVTAVAGLTEEVIQETTTLSCSGIFKKVEPNPKCWIFPEAHGSLNVAGAIQHSCNDFFYETSYRLSLTNRASIGTDNDEGNTTKSYYSSNLGISTLEKYANLLGLGEKSGVEIPESEPEISDASSIPSAIGQGTHNFTTSQLARYITTVANKGTVYNLSLVDKVLDVEGELVVDFTPETANEIEEIGTSTWNTVHNGMIQMVQNNRTFTGISSKGISMGGKTGTAQQSATHPDHALFVGFAPASNPSITISVRIANGYSSTYAAEVGRDITTSYLGNEESRNVVTGAAAELGATTSGD